MGQQTQLNGLEVCTGLGGGEGRGGEGDGHDSSPNIECTCDIWGLVATTEASMDASGQDKNDCTVCADGELVPNGTDDIPRNTSEASSGRLMVTTLGQC